jgi:hypothetical protein
MDGPHLQALREALGKVGGSKERLASVLAIGLDDLEAYLAGKEIPHRVFLTALDIISGR